LAWFCRLAAGFPAIFGAAFNCCFAVKIAGQRKPLLVMLGSRRIPLKEGLMNSIMQSPFGMTYRAGWRAVRGAGFNA
jgi:hypothetical protein